MTKDEIRAEIERLETMLNEPDFEAYRNAADAMLQEEHDPIDICETPMGLLDRAVIYGLIAAWPHMPETKALQEENEALKAAIARDYAGHSFKVEATYQPNVWYDWHGGECPVKPNTKVIVKFGDDSEEFGPHPAKDWSDGSDCWWKWEDANRDNQITSFKIIAHP